MMWDSAAFGGWNFRGGNLDPLVNLNRIAVDDFAVELEGKFDGERAFSGSSGANDGEDRFWKRRRAHAREDSMRKRITSQMRRRRTRPPMICERENFIGQISDFKFEISNFKFRYHISHFRSQFPI